MRISAGPDPDLQVGSPPETIDIMSTAQSKFEVPIGPTDRYAVVPSPIGPLLLLGNAEQITGLQFGVQDVERTGLAEDTASLAPAIEQLQQYFHGERDHFDLRLAPVGTEFQLKVWAALTDIASGETAGYGTIATRIGAPGAARAVGAANHVNPIVILIPCHRVIGADGSLTGFGGGLALKRRLLDVEIPGLF